MSMSEPPLQSSATLVLPCLNEEECLAHFLEECIAVFKNDKNRIWKIIVVDNGSTDRSREIAQSYPTLIVDAEIRGYGAAVDSGIRCANTEFVVFADADGTYDPLDAIRLVDLAESENVDFVLGNRLNDTLEKGAMPLLHRYFGTPLLSKLISFTTGIKISDCNCGIRCIRRSAYLNWNIKSRGMEYASDMILSAIRSDSKIIQTPVKLRNASHQRTPKLNPLRDGLRHLHTIVNFICCQRGETIITFAAFLLAIMVTSIFNLLSNFIPNSSLLFGFNSSHQEQARAFLHGRIAVGDNPIYAMRDMTFIGGYTYQLWGLGVGLLRVPFEYIAEMCGYDVFPDRVIFMLAVLIVTFLILKNVSLYFWSKRASSCLPALLASLTTGLLIASALILQPGIINLVTTHFAIYEETVAYGCLVGLLLYALTIYLVRRASSSGILTISLVSGLAIFFRPTSLFYIIPTAVAIFILIKGKKNLLHLRVFSLILFAVGPCIQLIFNKVRFDRFLEFGYSLNLSNIPLNDYSLRFDYPYSRTPFVAALRELITVLFYDQHLNGFLYYQNNIFVGQTSGMRFRELYFNAFPNFMFYIICSAICSFPFIFYLAKKNKFSLTSISTAWALLSLLLMGGFYLRAPSIVSRYMIDFAPCFAVLCTTPLIFVAEYFFQKKLFYQLSFLAFCLTGAIITHNFILSNNIDWSRKADAFKAQLPKNYDEASRNIANQAAWQASNLLRADALPNPLKCDSSMQNFNRLIFASGWSPESRCTVGPHITTLMKSAACYELQFKLGDSKLSSQQFQDFLNGIRMKEELDLLENYGTHIDNDIGKVQFCNQTPRDRLGLMKYFSIAIVAKDRWMNNDYSVPNIILEKISGLS